MSSPIAPPDPSTTTDTEDQPREPVAPKVATVAIPVVAVAALAVMDLDALRTIVTATAGSPQAIAIVIGIIAALVGLSALARRAGVRGWGLTAVVLIPMAAIGAWAIAPYFMEGEVLDEALPVALAPADQAAAGAEGDEPAAASPAQDVEPAAPVQEAEPTEPTEPTEPAAADEVAGQDAPAEEAPADEQAEEAAAPDVPAEEPAPPAGPVQLSSGSFVGLDNHFATGTAAGIDLGDGTQVVQLQEVDLQRVPDAHVYLVPTVGATAPTDGAVYLEPLKAEMGTHHYELPAEVDLSSGEWTLLVWCEAFASPVGGATLA